MAGDRITQPDFDTGIRYESLERKRKEIRLLEFHIGEQRAGEPLRCHMITTCLVEKEYLTYCAVSYSWSDLQSPVPLIVDGQPGRVPKASASALRRFVLSPAGCEDGGLLLWMDILCINQLDREERGHQVGMMADIYAEASLVLIWLGEDPDGTAKDAVSSLRAVVQQCKDITGSASLRETLQKVTHQETDSVNNPALADQHAPLPETCKISAISSFFSARWFSRVWVLQEAHAAREAVCFWGSEVIPWRDVLLAVVWLWDRSHLPGKDADIGGIAAIAQTREMASYALLERDMVDVLRLGLSSGATDPRDKVFAVLGMVSDGKPTTNIPDYSRSVESIYADATRTANVSSGDLDILEEAYKPVHSPHSEHVPDLDLPSWVPAYHLQWTERMCVSHVRAQLGQIAADNLPVLILPSDPGARVLTLQGLVVEEIIHIGPTIDPNISATYRELLHSIISALGRAVPSCLSSRYSGIWLRFISALATDGTALFVGSADHMKFQSGVRKLAEWCQRISPGNAVDTPDVTSELFGSLVSDNDVRTYLYEVARLARSRKPFSTKSGRPGLGPNCFAIGDKLCVLSGGDVPFVLHQETEDTWTLCGTAYMKGIVAGEYVRELREKGTLEQELRWFNIY